MSCTIAEGSGKDYQVQVDVAGQRSSPSSSLSPFRYSTPEITDVVVTGSDSVMKTNGDSNITISGTNFGPACTGCVSADYSSGSNAYSSTCDVVGNTHDTLSCSTEAGVGEGHSWVVTVGTQASNASSVGGHLVSYAAPVLDSSAPLSGAGLADAATEGGDTVTILGSNFGPVSHTDVSVVYGPPSNRNLYTALSCTVLSQTQIQCQTVPGVGIDLKWKVTVGGQTTGLSATASTYIAPVISNLTGNAALEAGSPTSGGTSITISGSNFGPKDGEVDGGLVVTYGSDGTGYNALNCVVSMPRCRGAGFSFN